MADGRVQCHQYGSVNEGQRDSIARAFRQALEARLQVRARAAGVDVGRLRKQVDFDCFLTRIFPAGSDEAGCVLERRLCSAQIPGQKTWLTWCY
jgi:hypothetical protein